MLDEGAQQADEGTFNLLAFYKFQRSFGVKVGTYIVVSPCLQQLQRFLLGILSVVSEDGQQVQLQADA